MGTRWICNVRSEGLDSDIITTVYGQFDGYPTGAGNSIRDIFKNRKLVNGIPGGDRTKFVNGMNCAAALLISSEKGLDVGGIYVYPPGAKDMWENYAYELYSGGDQINLKLGDLYDGPISGFDGEAIEESENDE